VSLRQSIAVSALVAALCPAAAAGQVAAMGLVVAVVATPLTILPLMGSAAVALRRAGVASVVGAAISTTIVAYLLLGLMFLQMVLRWREQLTLTHDTTPMLVEKR
jgi:hypothetical protein